MCTSQRRRPGFMAAAVLSGALLGTAALAGEPPGNSSDGNYMDMAVATGYIPTLGRALAAAGLVENLRGPGAYTLFAPSEAAFARLPPGALDDLLKPENRARLRSLLLGHMVSGALPPSVPGSTVRLPNESGSALEVASGAAGLTVNGVRVGASVLTANGTIHMIDAVLLPSG